MNWLLMPHARITMKRSGCVPAQVADAWLSQIDGLAAVVETTSPDEGDRCLVAERLAASVATMRQSSFGCDAPASQAEVRTLEAALESLMSRLELTYSGYPPGWE